MRFRGTTQNEGDAGKYLAKNDPSDLSAKLIELSSFLLWTFLQWLRDGER
jgi:hypothetical protein